MKYYPALLDLQSKKCCVVGGGAIALRKTRSLLSAGAVVTVIAPLLSKHMKALADKGAISWRRQPYCKGHLRGAFLVIAATSDPLVNRSVSKDASKLRILANIVDRPALSNFIVPAVLSSKDLIIAVSTSGKAPALCKRIKEDLRVPMREKYSRALARIARERAKLMKGSAGLGARKAILTRMAERELHRS